MEAVESFLVLGVGGPGLTAVKKSAEHARLVDLDFGVCVELFDQTLLDSLAITDEALARRVNISDRRINYRQQT